MALLWFLEIRWCSVSPRFGAERNVLSVVIAMLEMLKIGHTFTVTVRFTLTAWVLYVVIMLSKN